ncbi:hypothetical protein OAO48_02505 [Alphaproteobacteria bacterium]|jgi:transposase-like protein|nr:hypothetical protein [Alphaproteobacteria bacterium]
MSIKLNEKQLIAVHLLASGVKASIIAKELGIREETLSRWRQNDTFSQAIVGATEIILKEIIDTHKNLLITSQNIIANVLNDEELDALKKANIALRYLSLMKGKDDISQKSSENLFKHTHLGNFNFSNNILKI